MCMLSHLFGLDSLKPHRLQPAKLLHCLMHCRQILYHSATWEAPQIFLLESYAFHSMTKFVYVILFCLIIRSQLDTTLRWKMYPNKPWGSHWNLSKRERWKRNWYFYTCMLTFFQKNQLWKEGFRMYTTISSAIPVV